MEKGFIDKENYRRELPEKLSVFEEERKRQVFKLQMKKEFLRIAFFTLLEWMNLFLNDVCLECRKGEITGIVGRNGSGKTVLFKTICGLLILDQGEILIDGEQRKNRNFEESRCHNRGTSLLGNYSGYKNLEFLYMIHNISLYVPTCA